MTNLNPNTALWNQVCVTDPAAVKPITGKPYKGNSPKPYWLIWRATEVFGPCGEGWGVEVKSEGFHRMTETDVMHSAVVVVWYMRDGKRCQVEQMGQTKACYAKSGGGMVVDEDAGKKSVTDGMVKCLSMIGFAGDIFSGRWDDSSYVEWAAEQYAPPPPTITEKQAADIEALIQEVGADKVQFLAWVASMTGAEIAATQDIPAAAAQPAIRALEKKRVKGKAKSAGATKPAPSTSVNEMEDVPYCHAIPRSKGQASGKAPLPSLSQGPRDGPPLLPVQETREAATDQPRASGASHQPLEKLT